MPARGRPGRPRGTRDGRVATDLGKPVGGGATYEPRAHPIPLRAAGKPSPVPSNLLSMAHVPPLSAASTREKVQSSLPACYVTPSMHCCDDLTAAPRVTYRIGRPWIRNRGEKRADSNRCLCRRFLHPTDTAAADVVVNERMCGHDVRASDPQQGRRFPQDDGPGRRYRQGPHRRSPAHLTTWRPGPALLPPG